MQQTDNSQKGDINLTISIITLNINDLNVPIRRQKLSEWILKRPNYKDRQVKKKKDRNIPKKTLTKRKLGQLHFYQTKEASEQ